MKVNVLTVDDVEIPRWRWWSDWIDIAVFSWGAKGYLLQMRISRTNAKKFRCRSFGQYPYATITEAGDLVQMKKEES